MQRSSNGNANVTGRRQAKLMRLMLIAGLWQCVHAGAHAAAPPPVAGPASFISQIIIPAGSANGATTIKYVHRGFRFVIQTVSFFRTNVVAGSIGQVFIQATYNKATGYYALPEAVADGVTYPAATLNATINCDQSTDIVANAYRTGSDSAEETENIVVTGNYVAVAE